MEESLESNLFFTTLLKIGENWPICQIIDVAMAVYLIVSPAKLAKFSRNLSLYSANHNSLPISDSDFIIFRSICNIQEKLFIQ